MFTLFKSLLIGTIFLQLIIALTQSGWVKSTAELSAFLLVVLLSVGVKQLTTASLKNTQKSSPIK